VLSNGTIVEMVYDPQTRKTGLAGFQDGNTSYVNFVETEDGQRLVPYSPGNSLIKNDVILFPSKAEEYGSEEELVSEIQTFIHRYVDVSPLFEKIACYYVLLSWIYDSFNELPYLRVRGDAGSGKTRFLLTVGSLCYKPIFASGASTVSPLFRILDAFRGTLIVDEGDFRHSDEKAEITKILNNGNARGFPVLRSESSNGKEFSPHAYQVFGPKIVATRGFFEDKALESRCITEEMGQRKLRDDVPINLTEEYTAEALTLRNKLLTFRFRNFKARPIDPSLMDRTIEPRLNQVFIPLMSIIQNEKARDDLRAIAREYQRQMVSDRGLETEAQVLEIIKQMLPESHRFGGELSIKEIASQFAETYGQEYENRITPKWVGGILRRKLQLKTERREGGYVVPHIEQAKFDLLFQKYGISEPAEHSDNVQDKVQEEKWLNHAENELPELPEHSPG
jgi:hypothetical protein